MNVQEAGALRRLQDNAHALISHLPMDHAPKEFLDALDAYEAAQAPYDAAQTAVADREDELEDATKLLEHERIEWVKAEKPGLPDEVPVKRAEIALGIAQETERLAVQDLAAKKTALRAISGQQRIRDEWRTNITKAIPGLQAKLVAITAKLAPAVGEIEHLISATKFLGDWPNEQELKSPTGWATEQLLRSVTELKPWEPPTPKPVQSGPVMSIDPTKINGQTMNHTNLKVG